MSERKAISGKGAAGQEKAVSASSDRRFFRVVTVIFLAVFLYALREGLSPVLLGTAILILLLLHAEWEGSTITVKSIATSEHIKESLEENLAQLIPRTRIPASSKVIPKTEDRTVKDIMQEESREAEVVLMGLTEPELGEEMKYAERLQEMVEDFPSVVLVRNSGWFVGGLV